jgi:hypothetical protein
MKSQIILSRLPQRGTSPCADFWWVLFADLVGYTRLSQTLDAEQIQAL